MRALIQRVDYANLVCGDYETSIKHGFIVFLGIKETDSDKDYEYVLKKIKKIRIFTDENGKINKDLSQVNGEILLVSQFSLYGSVKNNNRPSFTHSANKEKALHYYERMIEDLKVDFPVKTGVFGGHMHITYLNDGPLSIIIDSEE
ncbi:MAG: D-tyrosyl-tRNA(Tyr) deacylase [Acholeplasmataceae bacterium]|nr:D-tyrosyl-tRNA(Tyr) deacylase [Acholeplasmataceae bacterium]